MDLHISAEHVFIVCGYTDMRKSIDGLSAIIVQQFQMDPFQPSLFLFCGRRRDRFKALLWQGDVFLLLYTRFEKEGCSGRGHLMRSGNSRHSSTAGSWRGCPLNSPGPCKRLRRKRFCETAETLHKR